MALYNCITKEIFNKFNFEKSNLFTSFKRDTKIKRVNYCYVFPQRVHTWHEKNKISTMYFFLFWRVIIYHEELLINKNING